MTSSTSRLTSAPAASVRPRRVRRYTSADIWRLIGSALGAGVVVGLLEVATPLKGSFGAFVMWYAIFLAAFAVSVKRASGGVIASDRVATLVVASLSLAALIPLVLIVGFVLVRGMGALSSNFFTKTLETVGPLDKSTAGGAKHAILGTLEQVGLATLISVPLGLLTAVYLSEVGGRLVGPTRFFVDAMSGIPSIVAGLFVFAFWVIEFKKGFSGLAASLALAVLMLPIVTRTSEEMLKLVPGGLRESSLALGAPEWRTFVKVVLPVARSGLVTAVLLGVARVVGETAPLLMTAFGSDSVNVNPGKGAQSALPLFVYQQIRNPLKSQVDRAWTGALVLIFIVLILFTTARLVAVLTRRNVKDLWSRRRSTAPLPTSTNSPPLPPGASAPG